MRENFKIDKELLFKNNIREITSISLDSDYKIEKGSIVGNFIINGDYKIHEVSVNREKFNFKIPFKHSISNDIDMDTTKLEITDFVYDYKKDVLMVNIEYEIIGDRKDILIFENEESLDEFLNKREVEVIDTRMNEINKEIEETESDKDIKEDRLFDNIKNNIDFIKDSKVKEIIIDNIENMDKEINDNKVYNINDVINGEEVNIEKEVEYIDNSKEVNTDNIISNVNDIEDRFITYKVYKVKNDDTLDGIVLKYKTSLEELKEYNELNNISVGDKIIIPINE